MNSRCMAESITPIGVCASIRMKSGPGERDMPECCVPGQWLISPPNLACMSRCRFIRADLGVLAGDHIKSASDLGIPLVGIGLFYGQGYFRQRLDRDGWQREEYLETDVNQLADGNGDRKKWPAGRGAGRYPPWHDLCKSMAS